MGIFMKELMGKQKKNQWYNMKYMNQMAQAIYPMVKEYANNKKPIDNHFIDAYIKTYDENFPEWTKELESYLNIPIYTH